MLSRTRLCLALAALGLTGCDALFGIDHLDSPASDGGVPDVPIDAALPPCKRGYPSVPLVEVPTNTYRAASGDFNKDGKQDLAVTGTGTDTVEILLGIGDGTFAPRRSYAARNAPYAIVTADLDNDTDLDLVVANDGGTVNGQISVLLGNGDGTFAAPTNNNGVGIQPRGLALADFDGDTKLDLAVSNYGTTNVSVLLGNGDGTFKPPVGATSGTNTYGIVVADFNEDGKPDLATALNGEAKVAIILNTTTTIGTVTFAGPSKLNAQTNTLELAVGDLDGKGHVDLAVVNTTTNTATVLLGNGNGTFMPPVNYDVGLHPRSVTIFDVDHDGLLDVLAGNLGQAGTTTTDGTLSWLRGTGDGAFATAVSLPVISTPIGLSQGDFDGDTMPDLVVVSRDNGFVQILLDPDGNLPVPIRLPASGPFRAQVADLDGDGHTDLAYSSGGNAMVDVWLSAGGTLTSHAAYPGATQPDPIAFADLDGDTIPELIYGHFNNGLNGSIWVRKGLGGGAFAAMAATYTVGASPTKIAVSDLDLDGDLDLVITDYSDNAIQILRNTGGGVLMQENEIGMNGVYQLDVNVHDFNKDGRPDLVASGHDSNNIAVRLATGATTYGPVLPHTSIDLEPFHFAIADLDRNGKADLAIANHGSDSIGVLSGTGDGTFATIGTFPTTATPWGIALGDFDGDGMLDAATASDSRDVLTIVHGLGDGRFGEMHSYAVGLGPTGPVVGDFDGDGYPDFVVPNRFGDSVSVLMDRCLK